MKRKRRWKKAYFCDKQKVNIIAKQSYCKEPFDKCLDCPHKKTSSF